MRLALMILFGGFFWAFLAFDRPALAAAGPPVRTLSATADTSIRTRREAIKSIPLDRLEASDREKVAAVLSNVTVFRRMPTKVIDCDPKMYLFLVRHPDVVVSIWELLKISKLQMSETGDGAFALSEPDGASVSLRFVHQSHDTHVIYGEGTYRGPLLPRPVTGRGVLVLKTGYVRETNGRYYITNRLDCFLSVEPIGAELLTKTVSPLVGKTADNNFTQSAAFLSTISRTAEVSSRTIRALALRLDRVQPEVKAKLVVLAEAVNRKSVAARAENEKVKR
ncbi:MAG: hypothetical protein JW959_07850 [Pirellulales bacterium]|nr:hypothetical protein [Pirellulales bacterium]